MNGATYCCTSGAHRSGSLMLSETCLSAGLVELMWRVCLVAAAALASTAVAANKTSAAKLSISRPILKTRRASVSNLAKS